MNKIICLTGLSGSGKSEVCRVLEADDRIGIVRLGEIVRKMRHNENFIGTTEEYAETYRFMSVCENIEEDIKKYVDTKEVIIVDSIRTVADYQFFKKLSNNIKLIMIIADREKRLEWLRRRNRDGDPLDEIRLLKHDFWELKYGISDLFGITDKFFLNEGCVEELQNMMMEHIR